MGIGRSRGVSHDVAERYMRSSAYLFSGHVSSKSHVIIAR